LEFEGFELSNTKIVYISQAILTSNLVSLRLIYSKFTLTNWFSLLFHFWDTSLRIENTLDLVRKSAKFLKLIIVGFLLYLFVEIRESSARHSFDFILSKKVIEFIE